MKIMMIMNSKVIDPILITFLAVLWPESRKRAF